MHVVSIHDFDYVVNPQHSYHPSLLKGTRKRLLRWAGTNLTYIAAIDYALKRKATRSAWGIVFESRGQPILTLKNLGCTQTSLTFRRILKVNMDVIVLDTTEETH